MKLTTTLLLITVLGLLTVYMVLVRPALTFDAYTKKCITAGGVVFILKDQRICVKEKEVEEVTI